MNEEIYAEILKEALGLARNYLYYKTQNGEKLTTEEQSAISIIIINTSKALDAVDDLGEPIV